MSDKKLRYSVNATLNASDRSGSPKLSSRITGFFDKLISSSDVKCYICGLTIQGFRQEVHVCRKCGGETCAAHIREKEISEGNKQLMCAKCAELVELETLRFTMMQQVDKMQKTVKESEEVNRSLISQGETMRKKALSLEKAITDIESKTKTEAAAFEAELVTGEDHHRKMLEEVYALTADFREMTGKELEMKEIADALALSCHCLDQEVAHMSAACLELSASLETQHQDLRQKVPIYRLKKMLCRECYLKLKTVYKGTEEGRELFCSVLSTTPGDRAQPLEQLSCIMSCKSAYARLKYL